MAELIFIVCNKQINIYSSECQCQTFHNQSTPHCNVRINKTSIAINMEQLITFQNLIFSFVLLGTHAQLPYFQQSKFQKSNLEFTCTVKAMLTALS